MFVIDRKNTTRHMMVCFGRSLENVAAMTTKHLFETDDFDQSDLSAENSDTVVMNDDGSGSGPTAASDAGEDGYVDVKMRDASAAPESFTEELALTQTQKYLGSGRAIPSHMTKLFEICTTRTGEPIPTGWNQVNEHTDFPSIKSRISKPALRNPRKEDSYSSTDGDSGSASSEGDVPDVDYEEATPESADSGAESDDSTPLPSMEVEAPEMSMAKSKGRGKRNKVKSYKNKERSFLGKAKPQTSHSCSSATLSSDRWSRFDQTRRSHRIGLDF